MGGASLLKRARRTLVLVLIAALIAAACGGDDGDASGTGADSAVPETAARGGELRIATETLGGSSWDPTLTFQIRHVFSLIYDELVGIDYETGELNPDHGLAERWTEGDDGASWIFELREGAVFHNGDPVTSDDVKFSIERMMGPEATHGSADLLQETIAGVDVVDAQTVRVRTNGPKPLLPLYLSVSFGQGGFVMPKAYIEKVGADTFNSEPIGSGPYRVVENVPADHVTFEATDDHWLYTPRWDRITLTEVPEEGTRVALLQSDGADLVTINVDSAARMSGDRRVIEQADATFMLVVPIWGPTPADHPLRDPRVREALNRAIDREELVDSLYGGFGRPLSIHYGVATILEQVGLDPADYEIEYDPDRARALLEAAGQSDLTLNMPLYQFPDFPSGPNIMLAIKGYWEDIGIRVNTEQIDWGTYGDLWRSHNSEVFGDIAHYVVGPRTIPVFADNMSVEFAPRPPESRSLDHYDDPELNALGQRLVELQVDVDALEETARELIVKATERYVSIPTMYVSKLFGANDSVPDDVSLPAGVRNHWGVNMFMTYTDE